ncbi:MAG: arginine deiminase [Candidatus Altiarchaeales archaeon]|nr:arginine deiminase [Candidatus Altiarchaeales archaeon]
MQKKMKKQIPYGCDNLGRLDSVLLHQPNPKALKKITEDNHKRWLFDRVPKIKRFIGEHKKYQELLKSHGVTVYLLEDFVEENKHLLPQLPNLTYMHDIAVVSRRGAFLSRMQHPARALEEVPVKEALNNLGIPLYSEFKDEDLFEGLLLLSEDTLLVANTERHRYRSIHRFISQALEDFPYIIYTDIPDARRYMHPDTIYNRIKDDLALAYLPVFTDSYLFTPDSMEKIDFPKYMRGRGVELIGVSDSEQKRLACSFVPLDDAVMLQYDTALDESTQRELKSRGVELILMHPEALTAGGGSLRCLTLRLHRR